MSVHVSRKQCAAGRCHAETLPELIYCQLNHGSKPPKAVADELGVRPGYLADAGNPDREEVQFQARLIVPFCRATGSTAVLEFMAAQMSCVLVRVPMASVSDDEIRARYMRAAKEMGDIASAVDAALLTDNDIDEAEFHRIDRELNEAMAAIAEMRQAVLRKAGKA
jgi:hypothetical protein